MSLALQGKSPAKIAEEIEERLIVALKESSGVTLLDASTVQDTFLDLMNQVISLKEVLLND